MLLPSKRWRQVIRHGRGGGPLSGAYRPSRDHAGETAGFCEVTSILFRVYSATTVWDVYDEHSVCSDINAFSR